MKTITQPYSYAINRFIFLLFLVVTSCEKEEKHTFSEYSCLIVNQGNYSESNGSLCILKTDGNIEQEVYRKANTWKLASIIESAYLHQNMLILMCSNEDKVEILDSKSFEILCQPIREIGIPRYCAVYNNAAYITCTDSWNPNAGGQICKINLTTKSLEKTITLDGIPEGIKEMNGQIFVATDNNIVILDPETDEITKQIAIPDRTLTAKHFVADHEGKLWVSFTSYSKSGIAAIDPESKDLSPIIPVENMAYAGNLDITPDGKKLFYLCTSEVVGAQNPEATTMIRTFDIPSQSVETAPLISGTGFYGFNIDPSNGNIYTANVNGFITNSITYIYNASGEIINNGMQTGVGTCRFIFPK